MQAKIDGKLRRWRAVLHPLALHGALLPVSQLHARLEEEEEKEEEEEEEGRWRIRGGGGSAYSNHLICLCGYYNKAMSASQPARAFRATRG